MLPANRTILFQGDSITDCDRDRSVTVPNAAAGFGSGYAALLWGQLSARPEAADWRFYNRGISGNRIVDLLARWKPDALHLEPDLISILVGVNDTWHERMRRNGVSVARYGQLYRMLLEDTRAARPACQLVLAEPFAFALGPVQESWLPEVRERGAIVRELAREFGAVFVPYQQMFDAAAQQHAPAELLPDGVHPTPLAHQLMAAEWRRAVGL